MKAIILEYLHKINEAVINGEKPALEAYVELTEIGKLLDSVKKGVQDEAITEIEKHGKGVHELYGAKIQHKNGAAMYDFKHIPEWAEKKADLAKLEDSYKALYRAKYLGDFAKVEDGEVMELPKVTYRKDSIQVTLLNN